MVINAPVHVGGNYESYRCDDIIQPLGRRYFPIFLWKSEKINVNYEKSDIFFSSFRAYPSTYLARLIC